MVLLHPGTSVQTHSVSVNNKTDMIIQNNLFMVKDSLSSVTISCFLAGFY